MGLEPITVLIQQEMRVGTGGGGKAVTYVTSVSGLLATKNFYAQQSNVRIEDVGNAGGPGVVTQTLSFFTFHIEDYPGGWPSVQREWRIVEADGTAWKVLYVRTYEDTMQVDCEWVR